MFFAWKNQLKFEKKKLKAFIDETWKISEKKKRSITFHFWNLKSLVERELETKIFEFTNSHYFLNNHNYKKSIKFLFLKNE